MSRTLDAVVDFAPPENWRRCEVPNGFGLAPLVELDRVDGAIEFAALCVLVLRVDCKDGQEPDEAVEDLMRSRFATGTPDPFQAELAGRPACAYDWTDGVRDILTYFAIAPRGELVEVSIMRAWVSGQDVVPLQQLADELGVEALIAECERLKRAALQ